MLCKALLYFLCVTHSTDCIGAPSGNRSAPDLTASGPGLLTQACRLLQLGLNPLPKLTFIIVQKRHHTRIFPANPKDAEKSGNVQPGKNASLCTFFRAPAQHAPCLLGVAHALMMSLMINRVLVAYNCSFAELFKCMSMCLQHTSRCCSILACALLVDWLYFEISECVGTAQGCDKVNQALCPQMKLQFSYGRSLSS